MPSRISLKRFLLASLAFVGFATLWQYPARAEDLWTTTDSTGSVQVQAYFFWSLNCPHCTAAHPHVEAMARSRPWLQLHMLELTRHAENVARYEAMASALGAEAASVPALLFCGEMYVGWGDDENTGALLRQRLDACYARMQAGQPVTIPTPAPDKAKPIDIPLIGAIDPASLSLPALTLILAALDAFNPCAFFVLLFLLSMMAHQKSRSRMLLIGGVFVGISGLMYFAFMAAWLSAFQLFGHLGWVTLAAGFLATVVGALNVKDYFWFAKGVSLSIPESRKPDIFRRTRIILAADSLPTMLAATMFLAVAANFYELLCTAGFPMVYTRLLTLADLSPAARYGYLAIYNVVYVLPLAAIVAAFSQSLGARKLSEREGRLLKLMSGVMMIELGVLLLFAPERVSQLGIAAGLMTVAFGITYIAAKTSAPKSDQN
jgi:uncharacterized membrane protein HdeD (DUF308 family)